MSREAAKRAYAEAEIGPEDVQATGLAQCSELSWQLRGQAGKRQVEGAKVALQHNIGLGGAAVVTIYSAPNKEAPVHID